MQTKLGSKVNILYQRLVELWDGKQNPHVGNTNHGNVNVNQNANVHVNVNVNVLQCNVM